MLLIAAGGRLTVDLHAAAFRMHEPVFLHPGLRIDFGLGAIRVDGGHGDFDDELGGVGMPMSKIRLHPPNGCQIRLGLRIHACDGIFFLKQKICWKLLTQQRLQVADKADMET